MLVVSLLVSGFTGSMGLLLGMSGEQAPFAKTMAASAIAKLGLDLLLVPRYGTSGAAIAILRGSVVKSAALGALTLLGVRVTPMPVGTWFAQRSGVGVAQPAEGSQ